MSQTLKLNNFAEENIVETTELNADSAVAATSLTLKDNQGFASGDFVIIGDLGSEESELRTVDAVNSDLIGLTITAALKLAHNRFDQVTKLFGNQMKIYRASNVNGSQPADADFTEYATISIDPDQMSTRYTDASGSDDYWYKRVFYNPTTTTSTPLELAKAYRGQQYPEYASAEEIRNKAGLGGNRYITDEKVHEKRRAAQDVINGALTGLYVVPFTSPINPLINEITQLLAAGYLLTSEATNADTRAEGQAFIDQVTNKDGTGWLDKLNKRELKLTGLQGDDSTTPTASGYTAWPTGQTATTPDEQGGGERKFRDTDRY